MPERTVLKETRTVNESGGPTRAAQEERPRAEILREVLGIETPEPSYYGLLGLPELETDEKAVLQAGRRVKRKVRAYQLGLYRKQALGLLAEIGQAVSTLTNPGKRRVYDNALVGRWRKEAEALIREHFGQGERTAEAMAAWLTGCRDRGIPVARLMPYLMRRVMSQAEGWPAVGLHQLPMPVALWTYRDVVALGQALEVGSLQKRVESVKKAQRMLGIPQGAALLVAEEIGRSVHLFGELRFVRQARDAPGLTLLRLGRRIRRYGGEVGEGKVLAAVARVLGKTKKDLDQALARMDEPIIEVPRRPAAKRAARLASQGVRTLGGRLGAAPAAAVHWVADRPQVLVPVAVVAGILSLLLAVLVVVGVVQLYRPEESGTGTETAVGGPAHGAGAQKTPAAEPGTAEGPVEPPPEPSTAGSALTAPGPNASGSPPDWLKRFRKKYPASGPAPTKGRDTTSEVEFFGVKGEKRQGGSAAE